MSLLLRAFDHAEILIFCKPPSLCLIFHTRLDAVPHRCSRKDFPAPFVDSAAIDWPSPLSAI